MFPMTVMSNVLFTFSLSDLKKRHAWAMVWCDNIEIAVWVPGYISETTFASIHLYYVALEYRLVMVVVDARALAHSFRLHLALFARRKC